MRKSIVATSIVGIAAALTAGLASLFARGVDLESAITVLGLAIIGLPTIAGISGILLSVLRVPNRWTWVAVLAAGQVATAIVVGDLVDLGVEGLVVVSGLVLIGAVPGALIGGVDWDDRGGSPMIGYRPWDDT